MTVVQESGAKSCMPALVNMLNCWASYAEGAPQCTAAVDDLKACMAKRAALQTGSRSSKAKVRREWVDFTQYLDRINPPPHD